MLTAEGLGGTVEGVTDELAGAELFYVGLEMAELVWHAAPSMPDYVLKPEDLPSPAGLLYSPEPLWYDADDPVHGAAWNSVTVTRVESDGSEQLWPGIVITCACERDALVRWAQMPRPVAVRLPRLSLCSRAGIWPFADDLSYDSEPGKDYAPLRALKTAWRLMQQPLAAEETEHAGRASRKRMARLGAEPAPVRVIKLRRARRADDGPGGAVGREYRHQWVVSGHWRQQWYASVETTAQCGSPLTSKARRTRRSSAARRYITGLGEASLSVPQVVVGREIADACPLACHVNGFRILTRGGTMPRRGQYSSSVDNRGDYWNI